MNEAVGIIRANDSKRMTDVREFVIRFGDLQSFRKLVDETDRSIRGRRGQKIIAGAYSRLQSKTNEALELARTWLELVDNRPGETQTYQMDLANQIRLEAQSRHDLIRGDLDALRKSEPPAIVRAGIRAVEQALIDIETVFVEGASRVRHEKSVEQVLNTPLLLTTDLTLTDDWSISTGQAISASEGILGMLEVGVPTWHDALQHRMSIGDHVGTDLILTILERENEDAPELEKLRMERDTKIAETRDQLIRETRSIQHEVERSVMFGLLPEHDRVELLRRLAHIEESVPTNLTFHIHRAELEDIRALLSEGRDEQVATVWERLEQAGVAPESKAFERLSYALDQGDVLTANEYLFHIESGLDLPPQELGVESAFDRFFPAALTELHGWDSPNPAQIVRTIRERGDIPGLSIPDLSNEQADATAKVMANWYRARGRRGKADVTMLESLFSHLGFNVLSVRNPEYAGEVSTWAWSEMATEPVRDRVRCPVPSFGSSAASDHAGGRSRYRILTIWDQLTPEDIVGAVGDTTKAEPTFVVYFGRLAEDHRRTLGRLSRERRRSFVLIDEYLMLFLASQREARMPALFACGLPFAFVAPFVTTAGVVPPEVFYGREAERNSVMELSGSCFIYGGRQLGKTALLRHVERRFHDPASQSIALYIDLKSIGLGFDRPVDDFWPYALERLKSLEIIDTSVSAHVTPDTILAAIRSWISADSQRRILLLLDEADRFLEADEDFVRVARLKGLMDATERRFKVVFAGLHNVQRATRLANNPLAHLGDPMCIGPLFDNGEWKQARDLIVEPLRAAGYKFETPELVTRVLSQTNYYPSLLQLYGRQLLRHVNRPNVETFDSRCSPPYVITAAHVEDAYQSQELWQRIRERFIWTLDLDPRYRLIALLIAYHSLIDGDVRRRGMMTREILEAALNWWPQGLDGDATESTFRVLLDEMIGLGILRYVGDASFALRSANIGLLLGTQDEIEEALLTLAEQDPPAGYDPGTFRRPIPPEKGLPSNRYSPLTAQQESQLRARANGVTLLFGSEPAGVKDLYRVFPTILGQEYYTQLSDLNELAAFQGYLDQLRSRKRDGVTLLLVDPSCEWDLDWVAAAVSRVRAFRSRSSFVRVCFVVEPERMWALMHDDSRFEAVVGGSDVETLTLGPWHDAAVRSWLDDQKVPASLLDGHLESIREITGNWPQFIYELESELQATAAANWASVFEELDQRWRDDPAVGSRRAEAFGLNSQGFPAILSVLSKVGRATSDELALLEDADPDIVEQHLNVSMKQGMVRRESHGTWALDPIVGQLLIRD
jgi:hypothetical protein